MISNMRYGTLPKVRLIARKSLRCTAITVVNLTRSLTFSRFDFATSNILKMLAHSRLLIIAGRTSSLSVLKDCICGKAEADALASSGSRAKKPHILVRGSALTRLLKHVFDSTSTRSCKTV
jgi:hypothetical protein